MADRARRLAALSMLMLSGATVAAAEAPDCMPQQRLDASQSCRLPVDSTRIEVALPLRLEPGDRYRVTLDSERRWADAGRDAVSALDGDDGSGNCWMTLFKPLRRMPREPYMVLGVAVIDCDAVNRVCLRRDTRLAADGLVLAVDGPAVRVAFFANDVPLLNWNNHGTVWLTVQRISSRT